MSYTRQPIKFHRYRDGFRGRGGWGYDNSHLGQPRYVWVNQGIDQRPYRLERGRYYAAKPQNRFLRNMWERVCKRRTTRKVSPSTARFERRHGLR